ncbi:MAG: threonine ammonia-lyase, biosynthetic [Burkholderiales bacterium]|jgi:threonine dehydratase|nr:threonine ammonia-lyase, biosynthetic [Burkholderiales bacterium]
MVDYLQKILTARVYDVAEESALDKMPALSERLGVSVWLKREDQQSVFSFKLRGAYNKMAHLSDAEKSRGVIAASAGNHAQGVALSARKMQCRAMIVMPETTPQIKITAVANLGAQVVLSGESYSDAQEHATRLQAETGATFIHPYDDPDVIAGQGTIGMEILRQHQGKIAAIFVPIGGGGLIAGIAAYVKRVRPEIKVIGVQPKDSDAMKQSLEQGHRVALDRVGLFADGVAVKKVGEETFRLAQECVDEVITCGTDEICAAIKDVFVDTRAILEPAGALSIAGVKKWVSLHGEPSGDVIGIASGANANFDRLRFVAERAELGESREAIFAVTIPEHPGSFKAFCHLIGRRAITEFNYRYADASRAHIFVGVEVKGKQEKEALLKSFAEQHIEAHDLTDDEMSKLHVRHLVGGHAPTAENERVFRFEFPELPGALLNFLSRMSAGWNISLFHYRNHGADYGRVLTAIQVPDSDAEKFDAFLSGLGYPYKEETQNVAYRLFLGQ